MDGTDVAVIILYIIGIFNTLFIFFVLREIHMVVKDFDRKIRAIHAENSLTDAFSSHSSQSISKLAQQIFIQVKQKYNIKASNMSELANKVKDLEEISPDFKHMLVDFFEKIVAFSYKEDPMNDSDISVLKGEYKSILALLSQDTPSKSK